MATAVQVQYRRGTASQVAAFTGAQGEMVVDTTNQRVVVQDGTTAGGWPADISVRSAVADAAYTAKITDRQVAYTSLTTARVVTLCAAASYPVGCRLLILDESGSCSTSKTITPTAAGSDTINVGAGSATSVPINTPYGYIALESNGSNAWTVCDASAGAYGAHGESCVVQSLTQSVTLSGATTATTIAIPAESIVLAAATRVTTAVTYSGGGATWELGDTGGTANRFGSGLGNTVGTTNAGIIGPTGFYSNTTLTFTPNTGSFTAGAVRVTIFFILVTPPSS